MVNFSAEVDDARVSALGQLHDQLLAALHLSEHLEEFLLAAQLATALDTVRVALVREGMSLPAPGEVHGDGR